VVRRVGGGHEPVTGSETGTNALRALFSPRSIAIIGASDDPSSLSGRPLEILRQHGYAGEIHLVNPRHDEIAGVKAHPRITDVPGPVDLAVVAVRAALVPAVVRESAAAGVRTMVIFSSGFAEEGPAGAEAEREIAAIAAEAGMRVLGPNAEGFFNVGEGIPVSFSPTVDYERGLTRLVAGNVAVVSQSGGLGFALFNWGQGVGMGASHVISTGNEADLDALEIAAYLVEDPGTDVVALLVEGFRDPARLGPVAERALALGKRLVVAKLGSSPSGRLAAAAHTAHDAGDDAEYQAAFDRGGVVRVDDQDELLDVCFALSQHRSIVGRNVGILTVSGGAGVWLADACEAAGLAVPELNEDLQAQLRPLMPSYGSARNPVDATAQVFSHDGIAVVLRLLCASEQLDAVVIVGSLAGPQMLQREETALRQILEATAKPVLIYTYTRPGDASIEALADLGLAWYPSPARVAGALRALLTPADN
jgi:acyl-CoA synthetase (NDP forming)